MIENPQRRTFLKSVVTSGIALAGTGSLSLLLKGCANKSGSENRTNVVLITLDTTRADHLSCYGYGRKTSMNLDKIASQGMLFQNAISPSTWTLPSHASLFTCLFPSQHGVVTLQDNDVLSGSRLPDLDFILAKVLKRNGYATAGFVGGPFMKRKFGMDNGFDHYDDQWEGFDQKADKINDAAFSWIGRHKKEPFFVFINYFDPHCPYWPPEGFKTPFLSDYDGTVDFSEFGPQMIKKKEMPPLAGKDKDRAIDLYDSEILFTDFQLARLLSRLESLNLLDNTLVVITADHGESFGEMHQWGHGGLPVESQVRVPLIIFDPERKNQPRNVPDQVQIMGIYSTILNRLKIPIPDQVKEMGYGVDLIDIALNGKDSPNPKYSFSERYLPKKYRGMLRTNEFKYIYQKAHERQTPVEFLFDLKKDPAESKNLVNINPQLASYFQGEFDQFQKSLQGSKIKETILQSSTSTNTQLDQDMRNKLKTLGYIR